ncbi:polysaccharide export protein [Rhizobium cremeum]|uniref:polysaccharide biosynthesis/export family protein n=1 Tax=Rhizobium cremeum TaxID=2813827 RepID=UPI000DD9EAE3|nr:polysaccharide biosynthesis/export family protein [Rhizobium cremeum]MCJ7997842.1 polysaccharide export protein [Rhizobium cremeum]MCJ8001971.1 polysaccharide export protein [Rhizobium cremeum]MCJ8002920.1 polysaccharide export protein [Rhizobium cremeum]
MKLFAAGLLLSTSVVALTGCTATSSSGPTGRAVEEKATVKVTDASSKRSVGIDYALVDINKALLAYASDTTTEAGLGSLGNSRGGPPSLPLGAGDIVQVAVFESQAGGLFIPADAGSRPGNYVTLPEQTIGRDGTISVPYAGRVRAAGRQVEDVQAEVEDLLSSKAIEPQVVITKVSSKSAQVAVLGDVNDPMKVQLTDAGERVLDAISEAGGLSTPNAETYVTVQRRGRTARIRFDKLLANPAENIYVAPGDTIIAERERRTFLAFGATGTNGRFDFEEENLTLGEGLGKAGGLLDSRANPAQVLLYRQAPRKLLVNLGVDVSRFKGDEIPVVFRADLRDPAALFAVQKFPMQDKDVLYISNSDSVEIIKFLNLVNSISSTASGVSSDVVSTRDAIEDL